MGVKGEPVLSGCKASDNWTCVTFRPDLAKFGLARLEEAMVALMRKRVYDLAGVLGKTVKARDATSFMTHAPSVRAPKPMHMSKRSTAVPANVSAKTPA